MGGADLGWRLLPGVSLPRVRLPPRWYLTGGLAALLAFLLGIVVMRPAMLRSMALQQALASASPEERATRSAEIQRLRARGAMTGWVVMILLLYALGAMAVARYL